MIDPQPYVEEALHIVSLVMKHLGAHEVAKLLRPAPEGYRYEVRIVRVLPEANPVPASPFHAAPDVPPPKIAVTDPSVEFVPVFSIVSPAPSEANPVPVPVPDVPSPKITLTDPPVGFVFRTSDPVEKFEYRGFVCEKHGQQAHRRRRHDSGPWICEGCSPEAP